MILSKIQEKILKNEILKIFFDQHAVWFTAKAR